MSQVKDQYITDQFALYNSDNMLVIHGMGDEKHVHPLQLDVIDRCVDLWSNPGEIVFTPFMGVGSEVYSPVSLGRKAIGIELKDSYYKQAIANLKAVKVRFKKTEQISMF